MNVEPNLERKLLDLVRRTADEEIDCDAFLVRAAAFLDKRRAAGDDPARWRDALQHLSVCPECTEEIEALRTALDEEVP